MASPTERHGIHGTAFVEALIALPALAAILVGIVAMNRLYVTKLEAKSRARHAAWTQAESEGCGALACGRECARVLDSSVGQELSSGLAIDTRGLGGTRYLENVTDSLRLRGTLGIGVAETRMPTAFGPRSRQQAMTPLTCNTRPRILPNAEDVFELACETELGSFGYAREVCR